MVEARGLFEALVTGQSANPDRRRPSAPDDQGRAPWPLTGRHAKGRNT
ncbi:hypothetical protein O3Q52_12835 [Streptomyces sp. ActVer]|nr:hypothetical protein [Streptomyces sp. ActVer]MCZ4509074.1 hypothetical protein [Streptomyces sp. ActVer]